MGLSGRLLQIIVSGVIIFAMVAAAATTNAKPGCPSKCGDVEIPFPFGITEACRLGKRFNITCDSEKPIIGNLPVTNISIENHELHVLNSVAQDCYDRSGKRVTDKVRPSLWAGQLFTISNSKNKFVVLGCDTIAYLRGSQNGEDYWTGCASLCYSLSNVVDGSCSGVGCCEMGFPDGLKNISMLVQSINFNHTAIWDFNPCGYAFVVEKDKFNFSTNYLSNLPQEEVPLVFDWTIGDDTCEEAQNKSNFACQDKNSECFNPDNRQGYRCMCKQGYKGNPYLGEGCEDINECEDPTLNNCTKMCIDIPGNYTCACPKGQHGDGRKDGDGCSADPATLAIKISIGISIGLLAVLVGGGLWISWALKRRKLLKLKERFFEQNGGLMLQQKLLSHRGSRQTDKIFSAEELEKATNNYDKSTVLGQGGYGTVYKGVLPNNKVVAIKKSKINDQRQIEQFINEVIVLTQINHRNVVKLLGCCLETEVPLLVYEFITNGTLSDHIHNKSLSSSLSWEKRLKIAAETAGALAYLHFSTSMPIIHRDVKTSNILLDDNYMAKVSDFGASRLVPLDQKQLTTLVQGTIGYLDPEYFYTSQLTKESDVYSFGVVLAELLTGNEALSFNRPESDRNLALYFVSAIKEDRLLQILEDNIVNEGNIQELKEVANLAKKCLSIKGEDRPTMKEVAMELEGLTIMVKHPWKNDDLYKEETEFFLDGHTRSFNIDVGIGCSSTTEYDSITKQVPKALDDGR